MPEGQWGRYLSDLSEWVQQARTNLDRGLVPQVPLIAQPEGPVPGELKVHAYSLAAQTGELLGQIRQACGDICDEIAVLDVADRQRNVIAGSAGRASLLNITA